MDELRAEIRAAFEKEQSAHPPFAGLRHNTVERVAAANPRRERDLQWLVVAAAALLTIAVVVGLMSTRPYRPSVPADTSTADYGTPPAVDYGTPPAGMPLIYVRDPSHQTWLIGFDWAGRPRGTVKLAQPVNDFTALTQSPDGSTFGYASGGNGAYTQYFDRLGHSISDQGSSVPSESEMWADDGRHLCTLSYSSQGQWALGTKLPGGAQGSVFPVAIDPRIAQSGNVVALAMCSVRNDRAALVRDAGSGPTDLWVVGLSNGLIRAHLTYSTAGLVNLVASLDGALIGENSAPSASSHTIIRRISDGSVVAELDPSSWVAAITSDDSLALIVTNPISPVKPYVALMDVRTGTLLWRYDGSEWFDGFLSQPGGRDFAVMLQVPSAFSEPEHLAVEVVIVHGDGTSIQLPRRYEPLVS